MTKAHGKREYKLFRGYTADEIVAAFEANGFPISPVTVYKWIDGTRTPGALSQKILDIVLNDKD